ncbi:MAG: tRNA1(Val) (adenine(37)-N6)-methyltransferase [Lachnospiraceae bacterium]|nr:tRNA1(Val) (adenine(37)-N6)-methyltransferase [Lachnospiraceae bacterium]MBR5583854.1 tRNA1(Val) (adenine(37)-N6)-methyltransferase [Lachnospiraceae bacterium]
MDAVLLSSFAKAKPGEKVLDLGTGNGIIPILMEAKTKGEKFYGLEIQEESADLARRSVALNELESKIEIVTGDMKEAVDIFGAASFHVITMNPPYMTGNHGLVNPGDAKAIARHEITCSLEDMISQASKVLKCKGRFYMVHRPFRLAEIMTLMVKHHLEPKRMRLVYPYADKEPNMVLIEGLKGGNSRITVEPPLIVYDAPGVYTEELKRMYYEV